MSIEPSDSKHLVPVQRQLQRETILPSSDRGRLAAIVATCSLAGLAGGMALSMLAEANRVAMCTRDPGRAAYLRVARATGPVTWLGVRLDNADDHRCAGVRVATVQHPSPAASVGMEPGDLIVAFGGDAICSDDHLIDVVRASEIGASPAVHVLRHGVPLVMYPTLADMPSAIRAHLVPGQR